jgi:glycine oxidase
MYTYYDYILVGQGLAGSCLALQLLERGKKVLVVDEEASQSSSLVAAGLYNPITGRQMVKTWNADVLFPYLQKFYRDIEQLTGAQFLVERPIYRPFFSIEEQNEWMGKSAGGEFGAFLQKVHIHSPIPDMAHDPFGGLELAMSGNLQIPSFLKAVRGYLQKIQGYVSQKMDDDAIELTETGVRVGAFTCQTLVYCSGLDTASNNFFSWLPFRPVKGEVLTIASDFPEDIILNRGVFVLPLGDGKFRVGSTYHHHTLDWKSSQEGRDEICANLEKIMARPYRIEDQVAGIRPATKDRRPMLGRHPHHETIAVFNGLGTKGVSLAPYYSQVMADHLVFGKELPVEVNCQRFFV